MVASFRPRRLIPVVRPYGLGIGSNRVQIRYETKDNGDIQVACVCLKTDSWLDYLAFKQEAPRALRGQDVRAYARYLRAALLCLFGHRKLL